MKYRHSKWSTGAIFVKVAGCVNTAQTVRYFFNTFLANAIDHITLSVQNPLDVFFSLKSILLINTLRSLLTVLRYIGS